MFQKVNEMRDLLLLLAMILIIYLCLTLSGCTYSITMAHTEGQTTDLIDEQQKANAEVKPNLAIPAL